MFRHILNIIIAKKESFHKNIYREREREGGEREGKEEDKNIINDDKITAATKCIL